MSKRNFTQTGFVKKDKRSMARTRKAVGVKPFRFNKESASLTAKIGSIEHKFLTTSVLNGTVVRNTSWTGVYQDPGTGGICCPIQGSDHNNRDGRRIMVDQLWINGSILFPSAENIADIALCGELVKVGVVWDKQSDNTAATTSDIYTNNTGSVYGIPTPLRNPNGVNRFQILKQKLIRRPTCGVSQVGANEFSQTSSLVPFEFFIQFKKPIKVSFATTPGTGVIADITDNSFHVFANAGGDNDAVGVTTRMDCNITYNCRARFYG